MNFELINVDEPNNEKDDDKNQMEQMSRWSLTEMSAGLN